MVLLIDILISIIVLTMHNIVIIHMVTGFDIADKCKGYALSITSDIVLNAMFIFSKTLRR
jgi:hypothetical protein